MALLVFLIILCAVRDAYMTHRILRRHGIEVELNSLIISLSARLPLAWAISLGIGLPTALWLFLSFEFATPEILALMLAAKAGYLVKQWDTHNSA
jgi:hypothetical protein